MSSMSTQVRRCSMRRTKECMKAENIGHCQHCGAFYSRDSSLRCAPQEDQSLPPHEEQNRAAKHHSEGPTHLMRELVKEMRTHPTVENKAERRS